MLYLTVTVCYSLPLPLPHRQLITVTVTVTVTRHIGFPLEVKMKMVGGETGNIKILLSTISLIKEEEVGCLLSITAHCVMAC